MPTSLIYQYAAESARFVQERDRTLDIEKLQMDIGLSGSLSNQRKLTKSHTVNF